MDETTSSSNHYRFKDKCQTFGRPILIILWGTACEVFLLTIYLPLSSQFIFLSARPSGGNTSTKVNKKSFPHRLKCPCCRRVDVAVVNHVRKKESFRITHILTRIVSTAEAFGLRQCFHMSIHVAFGALLLWRDDNILILRVCSPWDILWGAAGDGLP